MLLALAQTTTATDNNNNWWVSGPEEWEISCDDSSEFSIFMDAPVSAEDCNDHRILMSARIERAGSDLRPTLPVDSRFLYIISFSEDGLITSNGQPDNEAAIRSVLLAQRSQLSDLSIPRGWLLGHQAIAHSCCDFKVHLVSATNVLLAASHIHFPAMRFVTRDLPSHRREPQRIAIQPPAGIMPPPADIVPPRELRRLAAAFTHAPGALSEHITIHWPTDGSVVQLDDLVVRSLLARTYMLE